MNFNNHSNLENQHAFLGASKHSWLNKDRDELLTAYSRQYATTIGTALHDIAAKRIEHHAKLYKNTKNEVYLNLEMYYGIPGYIIDRALDYDIVYDNLMTYVNDAIGYRMVPEQILYYSDNCFGTADAINNLNNIFKNRFLRIHDLKTGTTPVHIEQLEIYAALFCLEYNVKPSDIEMELCIYQGNNVIVHNPTPEDIVPIMDKIITNDKWINKLKEEN